MRNGKLGFGLAGLGMGAEAHGSQIKELKGAELVAVYGRNEEKARKAAETYGPSDGTRTTARCLMIRRLTLLISSRPNALHLILRSLLLRPGNMWLWKTLEISLERCDAIINACRKNKVKLAVIYQMRFGNAARKIKQAIDSNALGK